MTKAIVSPYTLIHALDLPTVSQAKERVHILKEAVSFYKIGLQLMMDQDCWHLVDWLHKKDKRIFIDLKFFDIPNTVAAAIQRLAQRDIFCTTVHGIDTILKAATEAKKNNPLKILAVTVLSSIDQNDVEAQNLKCSLTELAKLRATHAQNIGCDGVVCSGNDVRGIRDILKASLCIVTPGIYYQSASAKDQKRSLTIEQALLSGADYLVVGRSIANSPDPYATACNIQQEITHIRAQKIPKQTEC